MSKKFQNTIDLYKYFQMRPMKSAKVSEISEATAASPTKPEDRINFHIGNPVQDDNLNSLYRRLVLGFEISPKELNTSNGQKKIKDAGWEKTQIDQLHFLCNTIKNAVPYLPQGGFDRSNPNKEESLAVD